MRNYIATCVIAAASLASCTQNEDFTTQYNEQAKTIKFDVAYVGKNTRATGDLTSIDDKKFILWGAAYERTYSSNDPSEETYVCSNGLWITNKEPLTFAKPSGEGATGYWEVDGETEQANKEVAYPGANYRTYFTAIAPADEFATNSVSYTMAGQKAESATSPSASTRILTLEKIPVVQEIKNGETKSGTDYLISCYNGTTEEVALVFKHLLSKLRFAVWTDENTANGDGATTQIELNSLKIYLPKSTAKAKYVQKDHKAVAGDWTWSGFTAPNANEEPSTDESTGNYQLVAIYEKGTSSDGKVVSYYANANTAHSNWEQIKLDKTFFIAPTENETTSSAPTVKLYIDIEYTVKRKVGEGWSTTSNSEESGYSAGHKDVKRTKMLIPLNDNNHPNNDDNNEGLSHFHQGYIETLYICLRADQKVTFSADFTVDGWVEDPINVQQ